MRRADLTALMLVLLLLASGMAAAQDTPDATAESGYEIVDVLSYGLGIFEPDLWRMAGAEETTNDTHVLWRLRAQEDTLFFFVHLYFSGQVTQARIDAYYDADTFADLLVNYTPYEETATCRVDGLTLYEFHSKRDNINRIMRYWVRQADDRTVLSVNGITAETERDLLDDYGARLFPALPSCDAT